MRLSTIARLTATGGALAAAVMLAGCSGSKPIDPPVDNSEMVMPPVDLSTPTPSPTPSPTAKPEKPKATPTPVAVSPDADFTDPDQVERDAAASGMTSRVDRDDPAEPQLPEPAQK